MKHRLFAVKYALVWVLAGMLLLSACVPSEKPSVVPEGSTVPEGTEPSAPPVSGPDPESSAPEKVPVEFPPERDTELELVSTFRTGEDGVFYIGFYEGVYIPPVHVVDENGVLYTSNGGFVTRTSDGKQAEGVHAQGGGAWGSDLLVKDGLLYVLYADGFVDVFSMDDESVGLTYDLSDVADLFKLEPDGKVKYTSLGVSADGEVVVIAVSKAGRLCYRLDGAPLTPEETETAFPTLRREESGALVFQGEPLPESLSLLAGDDLPGVEGFRGGKLCLLCSSNRIEDENSRYRLQYESVYAVCDMATGTLSREVILQKCRSYCQPCHIDSASSAPLTEYNAWMVLVGETCFPEVVESVLVYGMDGELYLVLYYERDAEVYRLHLGFTAK